MKILKSLLSLSLAAVLFAGCGNKSSEKSSALSEVSMTQEEGIKFLAEFKEDYEAQSEKDIKASKIPEIKALADLKTKYFINKSDVSKAMDAIRAFTVTEDNTPKKQNNNTILRVIEWGPEEVPGLMKNPEFYVSFSEAVKVVSATQTEPKGKNFFTLEPSVKGSYHWNGTKQLVFVPSENIDPFQIYHIQVNKNLKSINGTKITGDLSFETKIETVSIKSIQPGSTFEKKFDYNSSSGVPLEKAGSCRVLLNTPLTDKQFISSVEVIVEDEEREVSGYPIEVTYDKEGKEVVTKVERSDIMQVKITGPFKKGTRVRIGLKNSDAYPSSYYILSEFEFSNVSYNSWKEAAEISFNQPVDIKSLSGKVYFAGKEVAGENIVVDGRYIYLVKQALDYQKKYKVLIKSGVKDIYGQTLNSDVETELETPSAASYIKHLDTGNVILEAQFPHKYIIEHQNLLEGYMAIETNGDPLSGSYFNNGYGYLAAKGNKFKTAIDNKTHIDVIDLDPYLKNGLGFVKIYTAAKRHYYDRWDKKYYDYETGERLVNIQVTDLGVTARAGYNKVCALVYSLSENKPVENAEVIYYSNRSYSEDDFEKRVSKAWARGFTDASGFVEIEVPEEKYRHISDPALLVIKGDDKVTYPLESHNTWRCGVNTESPYSAYTKYRTLGYLFSDRGLYKPGETVSYRGIIRILNSSGLSPERPGSAFDITLEKRSWSSDDEVYGKDVGILSDAGGFYGKFLLPKDIKPGTYELIVRYAGHKEIITTEEITVAYFEKAKFQASAKFSDVNALLGDSITAELSASYLAGGSLTGAKYSASWYRSPTDFVPPVPEAENYIFGPSYEYRHSEYVGSSNGKVKEDGATRLSINTAPGVEGQAYIYRFEAGVVDVSNQEIFTGAAKLVHPGLFYIGVLKRFKDGFAKTKEKLEIPYVLFKPDGTYAGADLIKDKINYTISRTYWAHVNQEGVDGVYSNWQRLTDVVKTGELGSASKGTLSFTPENAGYYTITFSGKDKKNNNIKTDKSFYVTGADYWWYDSDDATALRLTPDKNKYSAGETAKLLLESPLPEGDYIVTIERDKIYSSQVIHLNESCTQLEIPVKKEYLPVVYVSICSFSKRTSYPKHEYGEKDLDKPKGYYGVTALSIDLSEVKFNIDVKTDKQSYRPGDMVTLDVTATKNGKPVSDAELTLMVVDRAVIDLINYHVSDPLSTFYRKSLYPLAVVGGDSRTLLMDPVTYKVKSLQGGDSTENSSDQKEERSDFRPTALFEPMVKTDASGKATVSFKMPDSLTTYRVTAVGCEKNDFALNESEIKVQNPINVQAVQPRRLRVRDTAEAGVIISNLDEKPQKVTVSISVKTPDGDYSEDVEHGLHTAQGDAFVDGTDSMTVTVPAGKTIPVYFNVAAKNPGMVELVYSVNSALIKERLVSKIEIEKPFTYETVATTGVVESSSMNASTKETGYEKVIIPSWCQEGVGDLEITLDATQLGLLSSAVKYVFDYPYGCLEQQSSRILPLVIFEDYIDVLGLKSNVSNPREVVKAWFDKVKNEQLDNGGFPYWPGSTYSSLYVSLRFLQIYNSAKAHGYTDREIDFSFNSLVKYISSEVHDRSEKKYLSDSFLAYSCYVVSKAGYDDLNDILDSVYSRLSAEKGSISMDAWVYAGLAYQANPKASSQKKAKEIADKLRSVIKQTPRGVSIAQFSNRYYSNWYSNESEFIASLLELYVKQKPNDQLVDKLLFSLLLKQKAGYWQCTSTTARVFESIDALIKMRNLEKLDFVSSAVIKGDEGEETTLAQGTFKGLGAKAVKNKFAFKSPELENIKRNVPAEITFTKSGRGSLYYTTVMRYAIPDELSQKTDCGFDTSLAIYDEDGKIVKPVSDKSKVIILESGKTYTFSVNVITSYRRNFVAVRVPVPSGAQIVDSRLSTGSSKNTSGDNVKNNTHSEWGDYYYDEYYYDDDYYSRDNGYEYFYDNEAQYFIDDMRPGTVSNTITVRPSRRGVYPTPALTAECMYEPEVYGHGEGYLFIIK